MTPRTKRMAGFLLAASAAAVVMLVLRASHAPRAQTLAANPAAMAQRCAAAPALARREVPPDVDVPARSGASAGELTTEGAAHEEDAAIHLSALQAASPRAVFEREARDPTFASRREVALEVRLAERVRARMDFSPRVRTTCHTSTCEVLIDGFGSNEEADTALEALDVQELSTLGAMIVPIGTKHEVNGIGFRLFLHYDSMQRDHSAYEARLRQHELKDGFPGFHGEPRGARTGDEGNP